MKLKSIPMIFGIFCISLIYASLTCGAIIMKDDGTSMNYTIDGEQSIRVKTLSGESILKLKDIFWIAGKDKKRIRLKKYSEELIIGEIQKTEINIKKEGENTFISPENIIFYGDEDVDLEKTGLLEIMESENGVIVEEYPHTDKGFKIWLLPQNWGGNIRISNAKYSKKISNRANLDITFSILSDNNLYNNDIFAAAFLKGSQGQVSSFVRFKEKSEALKPEEVAVFKNFFYSPAISVDGWESWGVGYFYFCLVPGVQPNYQYEVLGEGNLKIVKTLSNVLKLPINIEKEN